MTDDPGVMGNLPRSRPGRRSEKRAGAAGAKGASTSRAKPAAKPRTAAAKTRTAAAKTRAAAAKPQAAEVKPRATGARKGRATSGAKKSPAKPRAAGAAKARASSGERAPRTSVREERVEPRQGQDPITAALRLGMAVGDAGLKVVAKVVERLPRP